MSFQPFIRKDSFSRDSLPKIGIRKQHVGFNAALVKEADLQNFDKVLIHFDQDYFRIGFEFLKNGDRNTFTLFSDNPSNKTKAISAVKLINSVPFIKKISELEDSLSRQFVVVKDKQNKNLWIAQLCPVFENTANSMADLKNIKGIYRYKRENGDIIYIGRGSILSRVNSKDRKSWDFDIVEYSIIEDPKEQGKWESYWLKKFYELNGKLPFYNKLNGTKNIEK